MTSEDIMLIIAGICIYVVVPLGMACWAIAYWFRSQRRKYSCKKAYLQAERALEARLSNLLTEGLALDAGIWLMHDSDGIADIFFNLLFRAARLRYPVLLPGSVKSFIANANSSSSSARLQKFQRAGLLTAHKDGQPLKPEDCPVTIQAVINENDLFKRKIDYQLLTEEITYLYRDWLKANIR